jgi:hypothetical protein
MVDLSHKPHHRHFSRAATLDALMCPRRRRHTHDRAINSEAVASVRPWPRTHRFGGDVGRASED